jgi:hypothetical protein
MSTIKLTILNELNNALKVPMMDVKNISNIIFDNYIKEDKVTYHSCGNGFYKVYSGDFYCFIPENDPELLQRIKELINLGWTNSNRRIRLDISSWNSRRQAIRDAIFTL